MPPSGTLESLGVIDHGHAQLLFDGTIDDKSSVRIRAAINP